MVACSPFGPAGEFAASRHGALTRSQAADHGLTPKVVTRLLRDHVLTEPTPGVLVMVGSPGTWRQRLYVATLASKGAGVAAARSAAALHGIDGYTAGPVEILVPSGRHIHLPELVIRTGPMRPRDIVVVDGIRTTNVARTLCDLGSGEPAARHRVAFEWAWRNGFSLTWMTQVAHELECARRPGPARLLALIEEARCHRRPTESALEARLSELLSAIPGVVRQFEVRRADGSFVARVDFAVPHAEVAVEGHSRRHHFGVDPETADADREDDLQAEGWLVRYVTDAQRRRPDALLSSLRQLIAVRERPAA